MNFSDLLLSKRMSILKLSEKSKVPRGTITDINIGRTDIKKVSGINLYKLSKALGVTMEELLFLDSPYLSDEIDVKLDKSYLEIGLDDDILRLIKNLKLAINRNKEEDADYYRECIYENVISDLHAGKIEEDTAEYIIGKYVERQEVNVE